MNGKVLSRPVEPDKIGVNVAPSGGTNSLKIAKK